MKKIKAEQKTDGSAAMNFFTFVSPQNVD